MMTFEETGRGVCVAGFKAAGVRESKTGVALIYSDVLCDCTALFTTNSVKAAPVVVTHERVKNGLQAVVVNSGNANACVREGIADAKRMCEETAEALRVDAKNVGVASTGIIGRRLNIKEVTELIRKTSVRLECSGGKSLEAAKTIMTTDTKPKMCSVEYNGIEVGGIAKGAGMIAPNMATMLCFITTNADIGQKKLEDALKSSVAKSFNMIVVDGDESTNDTVLLMSNKKMKCKTRDFQKALDYVTTNLAKQIVRDGEGATKFIELSVINAKDDETARQAVRAVLSSPLVKTAFYGENPNWGRIISKLGSVTKVDEEKIGISFSDGRRTHEFNILGGFDLKKTAKILNSKDITVVVNLKSGKGRARGWGCDMSLEYVRVNAEYN